MTKLPTKSGPWVASVAVVVSDKGRAKRWYSEKLGLSILANEAHWVGVGRRGKGAMIHLCEYPEPGNVRLEPGNSGILLLVEDDLRTRYEELRARGVDYARPPTEHPWGWDATIRDPDGNELLLMRK